MTITAGQVNYLLTDQFVKAGQIVPAPNSPLEIVFQGKNEWSAKQAKLRLNVFLDRTGGGRQRRKLQEGGNPSVPETSEEGPGRHLQQSNAQALFCKELVNVQTRTPKALATDLCHKVGPTSPHHQGEGGVGRSRLSPPPQPLLRPSSLIDDVALADTR